MGQKTGKVYVHLKGDPYLATIRDVPEENFFQAETMYGKGGAVRITDSSGCHTSYQARLITSLDFVPN